MTNRAVGGYGERVAERLLVAAGMRVEARNWRCRDGEIDLVARDGDALVICEVKTRRGAWFGLPVEAVSRAKAERLRRLAARYCAETGAHAPEIRFDVVSVWPARRGPAEVEHLRGAF